MKSTEVLKVVKQRAEMCEEAIAKKEEDIERYLDIYRLAMPLSVGVKSPITALWNDATKDIAQLGELVADLEKDKHHHQDNWKEKLQKIHNWLYFLEVLLIDKRSIIPDYLESEEKVTKVAPTK